MNRTKQKERIGCRQNILYKKRKNKEGDIFLIKQVVIKKCNKKITKLFSDINSDKKLSFTIIQQNLHESISPV